MVTSTNQFTSLQFRVVLTLLCIFVPQTKVLHAAWDTIVFQDQFNYSGPPDPTKWVINHPGEFWWVPGEQFGGRTHFPESTTPGAHLPWVDGNALHLEFYQYNALHQGTPKTTFQGSEVSSTDLAGTFTPDKNYRFEATVRNHLYPDGLVTSVFLFGDDGTNSDEIDYEFVSRQTNDDVRWPAGGGDPLIINTWNESFQKPQWVQVPGLSLTDNTNNGWDTFVIYWYPAAQRVEWWWVHPVNGETFLREETDAFFVPDEAMNVYFNFWAPPDSSVWEGEPVGNPALQPDQVDQGVFYTYEIDYVKVAASPFGDFDFDNDVDGLDFLKWQRGESPNPLSQSDLADWEANYGMVAPLSAASAAVPEPNSLALLSLGGLIALRSFRRATAFTA